MVVVNIIIMIDNNNNTYAHRRVSCMHDHDSHVRAHCDMLAPLWIAIYNNICYS